MPTPWRRLRESLSKSRQALQAELSSSLFERLDDETWERLEEALILADVGARTTADVVGRLEAEVDAGEWIVLADPSDGERTIEVDVDVDGSAHWTLAVEVPR